MSDPNFHLYKQQWVWNRITNHDVVHASPTEKNSIVQNKKEIYLGGAETNSVQLILP